MAKHESVNLDYLISTPVGRVTLFGREHDVLPMNVGEYVVLSGFEKDKAPELSALLPIVKRVVPSLAEGELQGLSLEAAGAVLGVAQRANTPEPTSLAAQPGHTAAVALSTGT